MLSPEEKEQDKNVCSHYSIQHFTVLTREISQDKEIKPIHFRGGEVLSLFTNEAFTEKKKLFELINTFNKFAEYKISIKCVVFLYSCSEQSENLENNSIYSSMKKN